MGLTPAEGQRIYGQEKAPMKARDQVKAEIAAEKARARAEARAKARAEARANMEQEAAKARAMAKLVEEAKAMTKAKAEAAARARIEAAVKTHLKEAKARLFGSLSVILVSVFTVAGLTFYNGQLRPANSDSGSLPSVGTIVPAENPRAVSTDSNGRLTRSLRPGERAQLYAPFVATDEKAVDEIFGALNNRDTYGLAHLVVSGRVLTVPYGTNALILEDQSSTFRVRILDGDQLGQAVWVPGEWVK